MSYASTVILLILFCLTYSTYPTLLILFYLLYTSSPTNCRAINELKKTQQSNDEYRRGSRINDRHIHRTTNACFQCVTRLAVGYTRRNNSGEAVVDVVIVVVVVVLIIVIILVATYHGTNSKKATATIKRRTRMKSSSLMHRCLSQAQFLKLDSTHLRHYLPHPHGEDMETRRRRAAKEREGEKREKYASQRCIVSSRSSRPLFYKMA